MLTLDDPARIVALPGHNRLKLTDSALGGAAVLPRLGLTLTLGEMLALFVALAMRRPALLILDEATSALDPQNEQLIARALSGLRSRMTILLIAHRGVLSDLADQTFQLDQGRLRAAA